MGENIFNEIADAIPDTTKGKMFGALCIKALNGKAGVMYRKGDMIFKLPADDERAALKLSGTKIFDPMDGRPMNGWVQMGEEHASQWKYYAQLAMDYVSKIEVEKKEKKTKK